MCSVDYVDIAGRS